MNSGQVLFCVTGRGSDTRHHYGTWADYSRWMRQADRSKEAHLEAVLVCIPNITVPQALDIVLQ